MSKNNITLAFDVYGTLIDTHGIKVELEKYAGEKAAEFSEMWRNKQLEYSFRRGLMQNYKTFAECTRDALEYTCRAFNIKIESKDKDNLMILYSKLPPFTDTLKGLKKAFDMNFRLFAFSNGSKDALETLLTNANIRNYFIDLISVDDLKTFKPSPAVYAHFLRSAGAYNNEAWLISSNPFDVIGAVSAGMKSAWVKRSDSAVFDPWEIEPTITVSNLEELVDKIQ